MSTVSFALTNKEKINIFHQAFQALYKINKNIKFEISNHSLTLKSVNANETTYCNITFSQTFFIEYNLIINNPSTTTNNNTMEFYMALKDLLEIFHHQFKMKNILIYHSENDDVIHIIVEMTNGILKRYGFFAQDHEFRDFPNTSNNSCTTSFLAPADALSDILINFNESQVLFF